MTTQSEIPIDDAELDALMAELDSASIGAVAAPSTPAVIATVTPEPEPEPEPEVTTKPEAKPEAPVKAARAAKAKPEPKAAIVPEPAPEPAPAPIPEPKPNPLPQEEPKPRATLQFHIDVAAFRDETKISEHNLDDCMMKQSGLRAYYGEQAARSEAQHARVKVRFEVLEAELYDTHRKALSALADKVTEKAIENAVKLDPKWIRNKNTVIEAETIANINRALVESLRDRKDMIVQLGADRRDEYKTTLRTMAKEDASESLTSRALAAGAAAIKPGT